jgi:hypothetical protein
MDVQRKIKARYKVGTRGEIMFVTGEPWFDEWEAFVTRGGGGAGFNDSTMH